MAYTGFAHVYDELMKHAPYDKWVSFTEAILRQSNKKVSTILDLGCGTGEIALRLAEQGYQITGVDNATEMLSHAMSKSTEKQLSISWINQDITKLNGFSNIDLCISYCDVLNYITDKSDVERVCRHVYDSLSSDGLFIFDIHNLHYAEQQLMGHTFADVTDELSYIWECEAGDEAGEMFHYLTFFQQHKDHYVRFDEVHHQHTYDIDEYKVILDRCGFTKVDCYADFNAENQDSIHDGERLFIIAQK